MRLCAVESQLVAILSQFQSNGVSAAVGVTISFNLSCWEIFSLTMTLIKEESLTYKWARNDLWKLASTKEFDVWKKNFLLYPWTFFKASKLRHNSLEWCLFTWTLNGLYEFLTQTSALPENRNYLKFRAILVIRQKWAWDMKFLLLFLEKKVKNQDVNPSSKEYEDISIIFWCWRIFSEDWMTLINSKMCLVIADLSQLYLAKTPY